MNAVKRMIGLLSLSWCVNTAQAVPELQFVQEFSSKIMPEFWANGESAWLTAPDGVKIHYRKYLKPGQEAALIILPGRTESSFKFAEVLYDLRDLNLAVFIIDHRGQGASDRETKDPQVQYVADFSVYKNDVDMLMKQVVVPLGFKRHYAFGHSMGANILSMYVAGNPGVIDKIIVSSPMLDLSPAPFPYEWMAYAFTTVACWMGFDKDFVFGNGPYRAEDPYRGTGSETRFKAFHAVRLTRPEEIVGGVSYRFAQQALKATWDMRKDADKLLAPMLMLQAGSDDVVLTGGQDYVCQHAKDCKKIVFPEALHELHIELDKIRDPWLADVRGFLTNP